MKLNNLTITKADKGNTLIIIIDINQYNQKINKFIANNKYTKLNKDHTKQQQKAVRTTINTCKSIIKQSDKWKYTIMNPEPPHIRGTIKLHKQDKPVRPTVNWKNSPAYKTATQLTKHLKNVIQLPNTFNIRNSTELINKLKESNIQGNIKVCSFDVTNMYSNSPIQKLIQITNIELQNNSNITTEQKQEIILLINTILNQNYIQHNNIHYKQEDGLPMRAPTSAVFAEIFIQHLEHNHIIHTLRKHNILDYYRYVDDILIVYNENHTNIDDILKEFNSIHPNIQYTIDKETHKQTV
jgi:TusA-related sulfurtransferase